MIAALSCISMGVGAISLIDYNDTQGFVWSAPYLFLWQEEKEEHWTLCVAFIIIIINHT